MTSAKLVQSGIFSVSEAAELVGTTERRVRGWISGYADGEAPILHNDLGWIDGRLAFSFTNLMEIRFLAFFVDVGIRIQDIRSIMGEAKQYLNHPHPLATNAVFKTDGKKIFAKICTRNGASNIYELKSRNYEMEPVVLESLMEDVEYDTAGDAQLWRPRPKIAPNVIVHPRIAFGRPVLRHSRIPAATLSAAASAEGSAQAAADWYDVPVRQVREAVRFERALRRAA